MPKARKTGPREVPLKDASRKLPALLKTLGPGERIALTVRGQARAYVTAVPEAETTDEAPSRGVERLVKKVLKAARK
jgi:antitoxin (DNA-binding transcriptional repressor) of toxin-antitoxin stability system